MKLTLHNSSPRLDKMVSILADYISKAFLWMKMIEFGFKFHWKLIIYCQGSGNGLALNIGQAIVWNNADPINWRIYTTLKGDELRKAIFISLHERDRGRFQWESSSAETSITYFWRKRRFSVLSGGLRSHRFPQFIWSVANVLHLSRFLHEISFPVDWWVTALWSNYTTNHQRSSQVVTW